MNRAMILGSRVDLVSRKEALRTIDKYIAGKSKETKMVVTAYSEFYVQAAKDDVFRTILNGSDLVVPDGVSVLAAAKYATAVRGQRSEVSKMLYGLRLGVEILRGRVGETVTGVYLFEELTKLAAEKDYKVFLLGSKPGVAKKTAEKLRIRQIGGQVDNGELKIEWDAGEERVGTDAKKAAEVIKKINEFKPDLLFVAYNPVKQEKWLWENRDRLKVRVAVGVGGTFDEFIGLVPKAPALMEQMGLKWLWRLVTEPKRIGRIFKAVVVFPWLIFITSLNNE